MVRTHLIKTTSEAIDLDYILHENNGAWQVINVLADGISDLSLKRADYTSILKQQGINALIDKTNAKISSLAR